MGTKFNFFPLYRDFWMFSFCPLLKIFVPVRGQIFINSPCTGVLHKGTKFLPDGEHKFGIDKRVKKALQ